MPHKSLCRLTLSLALFLPAAGCSSDPADPGAPDNPMHMEPPPTTSPPPSGMMGGTSMIPPGSMGTGRFTMAFQALIRTDDLAKTVPELGDLDRDGKLDLVMNPRKWHLVVWPGQGNGQFKPMINLVPEILFFNGWHIDLADFDNDEKIDIAVGDHEVRAKAYKNQGGFKFQDSSQGLPMAASGLSGCALGDFNGDGKLDYVGGSDQLSAPKLYMAFGDGAGGWSAVTPQGLDSRDNNIGYFFVADVDKDGALDFVSAAGRYTSGPTGGLQNNIRATLYLNRGKGMVWERREYGPFPAASTLQQLSLADTNGDGKLDMAVGGAILLGDGAGGFVQKAMTVQSAYNHFADMDGDGKMDLVVHDKIGLQLWLGDGSGARWTRADVGLPDGASLGADGTAMGIDIGDLNGNGALDIVRTYSTSVPSPRNMVEAWVR